MKKVVAVLLALLIASAGAMWFMGTNAGAAGPTSASALFNGTGPNRMNFDVRCGSSGPYQVYGSFRAMDEDSILGVVFQDGKRVNFPILAKSSFSFTHAVGRGATLDSSKVIVEVVEGKIAGWLSAYRNGGLDKIICRANDSTAAAPEQAKFSINNKSKAEGDSGTSTVTLTVTRSGSATDAVSVHFATEDGTATAGSDYVARPDTVLNFAAGEIHEEITVVLNGDSSTEGNETFNVNLSVPSAGTAILDGLGVVTIVDEAGD